MKFWMMGVSATVLLGGALAVGVAANSNDRLAPGLTVAGVEVGGLTRAEALAAIGEQAAAPQITVTAGGQSWTVGADQLGWRADAETSVAAAEKATAGRDFSQRLQGLIGQEQLQSFPLIAGVDAAVAKAALSTLTASLNTQPRNAAVAFDKKTLKYAVTTPDAPGRQYDAASAASAYAAAPTATTIQIPLKEWKAQYTADVLQRYADTGNALMRPFGVTLAGTERKGVLTPLQVANLYWVRPAGIVPDEKAMKVAFGLLTSVIDQPAQNARFAFQAGGLVKVTEKAGRMTDRAAAYAAFKKSVLDAAKSSMVFASKPVAPTLTAAQLPDASKLTLIHTGVSTYYHSSPERRTNVANAAARINGAVVPAGGTFSFLDNLGGITEGNGFVGGLIIAGGRTVDGLGGGVCQVSTTTFRALYGAGLPVLERNQHSYRVGYYEPQVGFEAAVYDPGLDLKMKNDTGGPLLIKTVNNDAASRLEVQVWGLKQARTVSVSPAVILGRTAHPPAKYVVNARLRPGTTKQVDWAADGYNLYITRTIKDAGGVRTDKTSTVYKPWQAVFEVGPS